MHKTLLSFYLLCLTFASCKKDENDDLRSQLAKKWTYNSVTENHYTAQGSLISSESVNYPVNAGDYFEFKKDGTWQQHLGSTTGSGTFSVNSSTSFELYNNGIDNHCRVQSVSSSALTFIVEGTKLAGSGYTEITHSLKK